MSESTSQTRPRSLSIVSIDTITADVLSASSNPSFPAHSQPTESQLPSHLHEAVESASEAGPSGSNSTPSQPNPPEPSGFPQWVTDAISSIKETYPNERIQPTMRRYTLNNSNQIVPKIKCLDCPGKLYSSGPGQTLDNFQTHLRNRFHKIRVHKRLIESTYGTSSEPSTATKEVLNDVRGRNDLFKEMIEASRQARTADARFPPEIRLGLETAAHQLSTTPINKPLSHPIPTIPTSLANQLNPTSLAQRIIDTTLNKFNLALLESGPSFEEVQRWRECLVEAAQKFEIQSLKRMAINDPVIDQLNDAPAREDRDESPLAELPPDLVTATREEFLDRLREGREGRESPGLEFEEFWEDGEMEDPEGVDITEDIETPAVKSPVYSRNGLEVPGEDSEGMENATEHGKVQEQNSPMGLSHPSKDAKDETVDNAEGHEEGTQEEDNNDQQLRLDKGKGKAKETDEGRPKEKFRCRSITPSHFAHSLYRPGSKSPCISWSESSHEYDPDAPAPWSPGSPSAYRATSPLLIRVEEADTALNGSQKETEEPQMSLQEKLEQEKHISKSPSPVQPAVPLQNNTGSNIIPNSPPQPPRTPVHDNIRRSPGYCPTSPKYTPTSPQSPIYSPTSPTFTPYRPSSFLSPYKTISNFTSSKDISLELTSLLTKSFQNLIPHIFNLPNNNLTMLSRLSARIHAADLQFTRWSITFTQFPENAPNNSIDIADVVISKAMAALINIAYKVEKETATCGPKGVDFSVWMEKLDSLEITVLQASRALWSIATAQKESYEELEAPEPLMCDGSKRRWEEDETGGSGKRRKTRWDVSPGSVCRD